MTILQRVAEGHPEAVQECLQHFGGLVRSLARSHSRTPADAEDAVQEIFIDVWRNAARYRPEIASEGTFVATIARRRLIDRYRHQGRRPALEPLPETLPVPDASAQGAAERDVELRLVAELIGTLRPDQQRAIGLALFHGLSHAEIAAATDTPLGTVKTLIRRGLIELRESLARGGRAVAPARPRMTALAAG